jgi:hypothetical protein
VQRHATSRYHSCGDLRAAETARRLDADALRTHAHGTCDRFLHRTPERDATLELQGDVLGHELRVDVGPPHLVDVDERLLLRELLELRLELLDLGALLADDDAGARGVDVDLRLIRGALDLDLGNARMVEPLLQEVADLDVLVEELGVLPPGEPARVPALDDAEAKTLRMYFLSHRSQSSPP